MKRKCSLTYWLLSFAEQLTLYPLFQALGLIREREYRWHGIKSVVISAITWAMIYFGGLLIFQRLGHAEPGLDAIILLGLVLATCSAIMSWYSSRILGRIDSAMALLKSQEDNGKNQKPDPKDPADHV